jgi:hypothetical protein
MVMENGKQLKGNRKWLMENGKQKIGVSVQ